MPPVFKNVSKRYADGFVALNNIDLAVEAGEMIFLTGHSGAGKSTLLKLIAAIERPTSGTLEIGGKGVTFTPSRSYDDNGWIVDSWPSKLQKAYYSDPKVIAAERPNRQSQKVLAGQERWEEIGYGDAVPHIHDFLNAIKTRQQPYENAVVGHRAASVAHMVNMSAKYKRPIFWDRDKDNVKAD